MHFATNHLGHFALALGLHDALAADGAARIVSVSSSAHFISPVLFDDIHFVERQYDAVAAYGQSKTANVLFAVEATARWAAEGINANAVMPGATATRLQRHLNVTGIPPLRKTPEQGAATAVWLAVSPSCAGVGGRYFEDCREALPAAPGEGLGGRVASYAVDRRNAERLWDESLRLLAHSRKSEAPRSFGELRFMRAVDARAR